MNKLSEFQIIIASNTCLTRSNLIISLQSSILFSFFMVGGSQRPLSLWALFCRLAQQRPKFSIPVSVWEAQDLSLDYLRPNLQHTVARAKVLHNQQNFLGQRKNAELLLILRLFLEAENKIKYRDLELLFSYFTSFLLGLQCLHLLSKTHSSSLDFFVSFVPYSGFCSF